MSDKVLSVYDPVMCCSTGVCGPDVDPQLVQFSTDLDWLSKQGVEVKRFNLAQQPGEFVSAEVVNNALQSVGESVLPMLVIKNHPVMSGAYPTRDQLAKWFEIKEKEDSGCCSGSSCC